MPIALVLSCGSTQHAESPDTGHAPRVVTYGPLGLKDDAKSPHEAVILGTDDHDGSTVLWLPTAQSKATVDAMFVKLGGTAPATGGITPVKLATAPNPEQTVQVGLYEEVPGGTGAQWRAGIWVSAFVAATVLGKDLTDFQFTASSGGYIDGASASGLMAGGFLASMTGATIDPSVTMTGIINPDGTIGPVGGIPEKFLGSIDKGKKRLGYPIGMQLAKSEATGQDVDLVKLAKDHGAEAVEIADVHQAYKLLTGKELPATVPVPEAELALDPVTNQGLEKKYKEWQQRLAGEWATILTLDSAGRLPAIIGTLRDYTKHYQDEAEQLHKKGFIGAAYSRMLYAWVFATSTTATYEVLSKVRAGNIAGAVSTLTTLDQLDQNTTAVFEKIGALKPNTLGGHLQMMAAFKAALRSWVYRQFATSAVQSTTAYLETLTQLGTTQHGSQELADQVVDSVAPTALYIGRTAAEMSLAIQQLDFEHEDSVKYMCSIPNVQRMSTSFQSAAVAGLNYFDALLVEPLATSAKITEDEARQRIAVAEPDYLVAYMASKLANAEGMPKELKTAWGEHSLAWGLMSLAGSELAYYDSAELIAKYYSLGIHTDATNKVDKIEYQKAFTNMLATAERNARENARAAKIAAGAIPIQAKLAFQLATVEKDGDLTEQVDALSEYWASSAFSQTAVMLARN